MKNLIYLSLATILSGTIIFSCKKEANSVIKTKQNTNLSLNDGDNSIHSKMGGSQFGGESCEQSGNYCAPEVIIYGICYLEDVVLASNSTGATSTFFRKHSFKNLDTRIVRMLIDGSATFKLETITNKVGYFSVTDSNKDVIIIPFK